MEPNMDDFDAIGCLKRGDIGGLELLVARHELRAIRTAFLITHDERLAEDVVQDVFLRFFCHARHFDLTQPFGPYFLRCVINAAVDAARKEGRDVLLNVCGEDPILSDLLAQARSVESQVEFTQLKHEILTALARLSPQQRAAIVQRYYLEMSEKEMTEVLGLAPGTVK
jgi:RNA polymerase sigma-70 factor, ECF subfamily